MTKFKVGDKVKFVKPDYDFTGNPAVGSIWTIYKIDDKMQYYWGDKPWQFFHPFEIIPANSELVKEKLGIK